MWADREGGYPEPVPNEDRAYFRTHDPAEWVLESDAVAKYKVLFGAAAALRAVRQGKVCEHEKREHVAEPAYEIKAGAEKPPQTWSEIAQANSGWSKGEAAIIDLLLEVVELLKRR